MEDSTKFIGIDIGGSHITAAQVLFEEDTIKIDHIVRDLVDAQGDKKYILNKWTQVIDHFTPTKNKDLVKVGIAMPGPFDYEKGISLIKGLNKYEALYGENIRLSLSDRTGLSPAHILFRNDAESFLHGEVIFNRISSQKKVIGITLGTGLGAAVSMNGQTKDVFRAIHPMHGSIAEEYISTRWFQRRFKALTGKSLLNVKDLLSQDKPIQKKLFSEFGKNLGIFLNEFIQEEKADIIIIGGNIARCLDYFKKETLQYIDSSKVNIRKSVLWENAALIGAACSYPEAEKLALAVDYREE